MVREVAVAETVVVASGARYAPCYAFGAGYWRQIRQTTAGISFWYFYGPGRRLKNGGRRESHEPALAVRVV